MRYIQHPSNNAVYGAPDGWNQKELPVGALPVTRTRIDGQPAILSFWLPDAGELQGLLQGKPIMLAVFGGGHPIVSMGVEA